VADLKLPKLPDRTPVRLTITIPPDLKQALDEYLTLYRVTYNDENVSLTDILPAMLDAFLASDRGFAKARKEAGTVP